MLSFCIIDQLIHTYLEQIQIHPPQMMQMSFIIHSMIKTYLAAALTKYHLMIGKPGTDQQEDRREDKNRWSSSK